MKKWYYRLYDFNIESSFPLPHFQICSIAEPTVIDIYIREGDTTPHFEGLPYEQVFDEMTYQVGTHREETVTFINFQSIGQYLIRGGREIIVKPTEGISKLNFYSYLNSLAMTSLLYQRGYMVIHGSSFATNNGAIILVGYSGSGKTTTSAAFLKKGYKVLSEDTIAIRKVENGFEILPSIPYFKFLETTANFFGCDWESMSPLYDDHLKKAYVMDEAYCKEPMPLYKVYLLSPDEETANVHLETLSLQETFEAIALNIHYPTLFDGYSLETLHTEWAIEMCETIPFQKVKRPKIGNTLDMVITTIETDL